MMKQNKQKTNDMKATTKAQRILVWLLLVNRFALTLVQELIADLSANALLTGAGALLKTIFGFDLSQSILVVFLAQLIMLILYGLDYMCLLASGQNETVWAGKMGQCERPSGPHQNKGSDTSVYVLLICLRQEMDAERSAAKVPRRRS